MVYLNGTRLLNPMDPNSSYLANFLYQDRTNAWNEFFFGQKSGWGTFGAYDALLREYEMRRNYGLLDAAAEEAYHRQFGGLAMNAFTEWQRFQMESMTRSAVDGVDRKYDIQTWLRHHRAMSAVGMLAAAYAGRTLRYRIGEGMSLESRTAMNGSKFEGQFLGWQSSIVAASLGALVETTGRSGFFLRKRLTSEVSMNYEQKLERAISLSYSRGF